MSILKSGLEIVAIDNVVCRFTSWYDSTMKNYSRTQIGAFVVLCLASTLLITGLFFALYRKPIDSADVAAWVQAVGFVVAILVAFSIANRQMREQSLTARERDLEAAARAATFGKLAAQRTLAAVDNLMRMLHQWPADKPFIYNSKYLAAAERLLLMALERDLPPEQAVILVSLHNDLMNILQGMSDIAGWYNPLGYVEIKERSSLMHSKIQQATIDAIQMEEAALKNLAEHRVHIGLTSSHFRSHHR